MLTKQNRLKLRDEKQFFSQAQKFSGSGFTGFIREQMSGMAEFTFLAPKKYIPGAVQRNKLKRQARGVVNELLHTQKFSPLQCVLVLRKNFGLQQRVLVLRELQEKLNRVYSSTGK
ncbi:MAG: ribonuclease P protein component [bacterium]|nr:ribonuclease P protein component [bacterium]